jgi:isopentenyl diphosphate isomerase/L-lactate dehydrogenase-like FMN-dependent dehydrogenase
MRVSRVLDAIEFEDFRELARRRLPRVLFDSIDGGAGEEVTLRANSLAFQQVALRPHQASPPTAVDVSLTLFGARLGSPVMLAPCGSARIVHPAGELAVARAAADAGVLYVVPHLAGISCDLVRAQTDGPLWYQIYLYGGREIAEAAVRRAWAAGYRTLVVTVDNARTMRPRDLRNGFRALMSKDVLRGIPHLGQLLARPGWFAAFLRDGMPTHFPNARSVDGRTMGAADIAEAASRADAHFRWSDFKWLREVWPGAIVAKGVLTCTDAGRAIAAGADGIIVSNHGGRTLDGLEASLRALVEIVPAVPADFPVLMDGGIRRATDVIKAICLGARAVLIGRPYMFALSDGEAGVRRLCALMDQDLRQSLAALGCSRLEELDRTFVRTPSEWQVRAAS